ncbi:MAG TPA: SDR family oxidoreductase [Bdellovibrionales bacterium]|nr:SDR family oxidoreductase [Bdellovibrionales bacterium]
MSLEVFGLNGRRALVCGASQGIGRAIAKAFSESGAEVILLARTREKLEELQRELAPRKTIVLEADLDDHRQLEQKVKETIAAGPIHILVNNAAGPAPGPILNAEADAFLTAFKRHIGAAQLLTRLLLPGMKSAGYGRIVNVISTSVREPIPNLGVSNTIRGAMASWAKTVAGELPPGVTINNILPGYTATPRLESLKKNTSDKRGISTAEVEREWIQAIPEGRIARPEEIAWAATFLASPAAAYIRGVSLAVDGGRMKGM